MTIHNLKIEPQYYDALLLGIKSFEIRKNDRDFKVGDILKLSEYKDGYYTGGSYRAKIIYITDYAQQEGYVVMGIEPLEGNLKLDQVDLLTILDWANGYVAKYYGTNPTDVKANLPQLHKNLIDRILTAHGAQMEDSQ